MTELTIDLKKKEHVSNVLAPSRPGTLDTYEVPGSEKARKLVQGDKLIFSYQGTPIAEAIIQKIEPFKKMGRNGPSPNERVRVFWRAEDFRKTMPS
jgi:hypothetical protein